MKKQISRGIAVLLCVLTAVLTCALTMFAMYGGLNGLLRSHSAQQRMNAKLSEIKQIVDWYYVGEYDETEALDMAATGFMVGVGDQWSSYLTKDQYEAYKLDFAGQLVGIGVSVGYDEEEDAILVTDVYEDSPAEAAGLLFGDLIRAAGDVTMEKDGYNEVVDAVRGEEGTEVTITVTRAATGVTEDITMVRAKVNKVSVRYSMLDGKVGYIRIRDFDGGVDKQFAKALEELTAQGAEKLLFDVRFNPGGSVTVLADMLDHLLPEGDIITLRPKAGEGTTFTSGADALDMPMGVLVNAQSVSAAEFFAAALQEYEKAVVVGEKTLGKGYSQRQYTLSDGSALLLSDQEYFTPKGRNLADIGIEPDVTVPSEAEDYAAFARMEYENDPQLQEALRVLLS